VDCHAGGSRPPREGREVADVFRRFGDSYRTIRMPTRSQHKVMQAIETCRTAAMGGHKEKCTACGTTRYAYSSCRNRHCPKCQTLTKAQWLADRQAELLPVGYFHVVFTLPHDLNSMVLNNKAVLLKALFATASATLLEFGRNDLGGKMGFTMVLHTWDQLMRPHFHVHCVIPAGALSSDGCRWIHGDPEFLFPVRALSKVFRGKYLDALRRLHRQGELDFPAPAADLGMNGAFANLIQHLQTIDWVVFAKRPFAGPEQVLDYLGRYTHRVAISNHRITGVTDTTVSFNYRDRRGGGKKLTATLAGVEFIRRFLLHVLPSGFMRIRHFGFLANRCKAANLERCRILLRQPTDPPQRRKLTVSEWLLEVTGVEIDRCPSCGKKALTRSRIPRRSPRRSPYVTPDTS